MTFEANKRDLRADWKQSIVNDRVNEVENQILFAIGLRFQRYDFFMDNIIWTVWLIEDFVQWLPSWIWPPIMNAIMSVLQNHVPIQLS